MFSSHHLGVVSSAIWADCTCAKWPSCLRGASALLGVTHRTHPFLCILHCSGCIVGACVVVHGCTTSRLLHHGMSLLYTANKM